MNQWHNPLPVTIYETFGNSTHLGDRTSCTLYHRPEGNGSWTKAASFPDGTTNDCSNSTWFNNLNGKSSTCEYDMFDGDCDALLKSGLLDDHPNVMCLDVKATMTGNTVGMYIVGNLPSN